MGAGGIVLIIVVILAVIGIAWLLFWWLYDRASKEMSFVRTGLGGEKVVMNSGAFRAPGSAQHHPCQHEDHAARHRAWERTSADYPRSHAG